MALFNLLPKEEKFFTHLTSLSALARDSAHVLKAYVESRDTAARAKAAGTIALNKAQAKDTMASLTNDLCRCFVTPFDREDIQNFAQYLYRICKKIEKVIERMDLHGLDDARADFIPQTDLIVSEADVMDDMVRDLINKRGTKAITDKVALLHTLENKGDEVLQTLLKSLFQQNREARDLILRKDIYDILEKVIDGYRNAASVTLEIVLKYN